MRRNSTVLHSPDIIFTEIFINNEFRKSESGKTFPTINPSTGEVIAEIEHGQEEDVDLAVKAAQAAFQFNSPWRTMDASKRGKLLMKLADLIEQNASYIASLEAIDNGKPYKQALLIDIKASIDHIRYYAGWADKIHGKVISIDGSYLTYTRPEPVGVCGQVIPWNFPLLMVAMKIAPALAAGNTVVVKPAEQTPLTALFVAHLIQEAEFPPGVVNIVPGDGTTGEALVNHPGVNKIAFTGSTKVGFKIQQSAAKDNLKRVTLELGGKSPLIVMNNVDIDKAVEYAQNAAFYNQGQACCALTKTYVHSSIYDEFLEKTAERAKSIVVGDPFDTQTQQGPQIDEAQLERILYYIEMGIKEGAELVTGGQRTGSAGYFIEPTVFANVEEEHVIAKEEIFGPVQVLLKFDDVDDVITRANNTNYGLAAAVFSNDVDQINYIVPRLNAGTVWVNCYLVLTSQAPFGGYKDSGIGRESGKNGLRPYLEIKTITTSIPKKIS